MNKLILLTSVAVFSFGMISESRAECATGLIACGDDCAAKGSTCHWEINSDGKLTITGSGAMKENFGNTKRKDNPKADGGYTTTASWGDYHSSITSIEIGEGITDTGGRAFQGLSNVQSVTIPKSLETVGSNAFDRMPDMNSFSVPDGSKLTSVSKAAFQLSSSLNAEYAQKILDTVGYNNKINGTTFEIPDGTFSSGGLKGEITIPEGVTSIGNDAFMNATGLTSITIPEGVTSIGNRAFWGATGLTSITIPEGVTSIGEAVFYFASNLKSITIPDSVTSIGKDAFYGASSLESITIPDSVTSIGKSAFVNASSLTSITIPEGVTSIGAQAFYGASSLKSITIPEGVKSIGYAAFGLTGLTSITIPDNINTANWDAYAFSGLPADTKIVCQGGLNTCYEKLAKYFSADDPRCPANVTCNCSGSKCIDSSRISEATSSSQCSGNYGWSGAGCSRKNPDGSVPCASGFVEWDKQCWSEYPFAKKRWTPAEANEWLHDGNDNFVVITFKK